jgi:hypothetical protein
MKSMRGASTITMNQTEDGDVDSSSDTKEISEFEATSTSLNADPTDSERNKKIARKREEILQSYPDPPGGIIGVCSSQSLEDMLSNDTNKSRRNPFTFDVPRCVAVDHVNIPDIEAPLPELLVKYYQARSMEMGGLGLKRKEAQTVAATKTGTVIGGEGGMKQRRKPKTLSEKRRFLQQDIMRYGVDAIERMYPRQQYQPRRNHQKPPSNTKMRH